MIKRVFRLTGKSLGAGLIRNRIVLGFLHVRRGSDLIDGEDLLATLLQLLSDFDIFDGSEPGLLPVIVSFDHALTTTVLFSQKYLWQSHF